VYELKDELREFFAGVYEIEDEIKGGGMSRLFLASDATLHRKVVIKILPPDFSNEVTAARFKREAQLTAGLQHPHILPIISAGSAKDLLYYVMPYVDGESLRSRMTREGPLPVNEAIRLLLEICDALAHAHANGVIHRDIKPENILLQGGHAVVADFGIAGALDGGSHPRMSGPTRLTSTGISLGTVGYMAPEQSVGERNVDTRADVYSLGVIGYEMIAGRRLFEGESAQTVIAAHLTQKPVPLDRTADGVPTPVVMAIEKALQKNPDDRFQTAGEFREALRAQVSTMTTMTRAVPAALVRAAKRRALLLRSRRVMTVIAIVVIAGGAAAYGALRYRAAHAPPGEAVTVAVAPFDALEPDVELWREGMVDVMARDLDGAGTLRTVSPAIVVREWKEQKVTQANAVDLGRRTRSRYALFGIVTPVQGALNRLRATLVDVPANAVVLQYEITGAEVADLADSLALRVIDTLLARHRLGGFNRPAPKGTRSIAALRHFLQGERFYRRTAWSSALASYDSAITQDSSFALPLRRRAQVLGWMTNGSDSLVRDARLRAGRVNRGLATRDSLLVVVDSIDAAVFGAIEGAMDWKALRRMFATVDRVTAAYPDDPEGWYVLGEVRYHNGYGRPLGVSDAMVLETFDRAIALDSSFGPAYIHTPELALGLRGAGAARNYAAQYVARQPGGPDADVLKLAVQLLAPTSTPDANRRVFDTISVDVLRRTFINLRRFATPRTPRCKSSKHRSAVSEKGIRPRRTPMKCIAIAHSRSRFAAGCVRRIRSLATDHRDSYQRSRCSASCSGTAPTPYFIGGSSSEATARGGRCRGLPRSAIRRHCDRLRG
jgi:serine/threonine-protein kinase